MIRGTRALAVGVLLPCALALGGCGGVSKDDYANDLDAACSDLEEQIQQLGDSQATSGADVARRFDEIRTAMGDLVTRMKDIERPEGDDGDKAEQYVNRVEATVNSEFLPALDDLEKAVRTKDQAMARDAATRLQAIDDDETQQLAGDLGADECAKE
jgi:hypothetical protein